MLEVTEQKLMNNEYANARISKLSPVTLSAMFFDQCSFKFQEAVSFNQRYQSTKGKTYPMTAFFPSLKLEFEFG